MSSEEQLIPPENIQPQSKWSFYKITLHIKQNSCKISACFIFVIIVLLVTITGLVVVLKKYPDGEPTIMLETSTLTEIFSEDYETTSGPSEEDFSSSKTEDLETTANEVTTDATPNFLNSTIDKGHCIYLNDVVVSKNGCFYLTIQDDGNMVIYRASDNKLIWTTNTDGTDSTQACMQVDGNFVLYTPRDEMVWQPNALWIVFHSWNHLNRPDYAILENDGQLVLKKYNGKVKWLSGAVSIC